MSTSASLGDIVRRETAGFVSLNLDQIQALELHYALLLRWNRKMNLTTVTKLPDAALRHYCESLFLAARLSAGRVVDVGSGAGFPGIPVAIARPDCMVDLVESHQRKAVFLREASRGMGNVRVAGARAESLRGAGEQPTYEWMISRAVDPVDLLRLRLANRYALLIGAEDVELVKPDEVIPLPWGARRVLAVGTFHVKQSTITH